MQPLEQALKEWIFDRASSQGIGRSDYVQFGIEFERQRILEACWKSGKTTLTLEEIKEIVGSNER